ncbi:hypothetical protein ACHHV8_36705 [Paenibacillus sp. TAB 01]|uniref:hypothetical protein n=1 Tax=Paenibacillus sp. TAB 01 TaxID=3368988 RepID=UPI0037527410
MANMTSLQVRIVGNACITRFNAGEAPTLTLIIASNYDALNDPGREEDRKAVVAYVAAQKPEIPL